MFVFWDVCTFEIRICGNEKNISISYNSMTRLQKLDIVMHDLVATGCGRKNSPIWEGHSFGWGARRVVGSASSKSGVRAVFSVHHGVVGRTSSLYC